ncbi:MAG: hypothetical protein O3B01_18545 [Planctomycetota bacterium]|nr:hypothetical protein [Planctomycetota bacterium]MDA1140572.1 hypothetical protein [Planctomycetota bacterium]
MNIPLTIHEPTGLPRKGQTILGGIPLSRGLCMQGGWFRISNSDTESVLEGQPAAWWPDGSVKWMHLCGALDLKPGANEFILEETGKSPASRLTVSTADGVVRVEGEELSIQLTADDENILSVFRAGNQDSLLERPGISASLSYVGPDDSDAQVFRFEPRTLHLVTDSASRAVLRLGGVFTNADADSGSELILFVEVYQGSPELRIQAVFIYGGVPEKDLIKELKFTVHSKHRGDSARYAFSNEKGRGYWDVMQRVEDGPRWPQARQVQLGSSFYKTQKRVCPEGSWVKATEGQRAQGWCFLGDETGGLSASTRYFWQEYPRAYSIDADVGTLTFDLWPASAEPLDLRRYSPIIYGAPVYEYLPKWAEGGRFPSTSGAPGIAKSHELMLRFHRPEDEDVPERGQFFAQPCRLIPNPEQLCESLVLGHVSEKSDRFPEAEAHMEQMTEFIVQERANRGWYGQMDFGDVMIAYYSDIDRWGFDDGGYAWINTEHLPDLGLWISAMRAGRPDWLEAAIEMSRHNRDIDMYHRGETKGYGTRHNVNHWGCADKEWRISMPLVRRFHYYLTADPWTAETIRETVAVFQSFERTARIAPSMTSSLAGIMVKYEMSGDPADGDVLRKLSDVFAAAFDEGGMMTCNLHADLATGEGYPEGDEKLGSFFFMNGFGGQHTLVEIAEVLKHEPLSAAIERHVRYCMNEESSGMSQLLFLSHLFRRTGDKIFKTEIDKGLVNLNITVEESGGEGPLDEPRFLRLVKMSRKNKIACHIAGTILHTLPYGMSDDPDSKELE